MNQPNKEALKFLELYTNSVKEYNDFLTKNMAVIMEYEARTERKRIDEFTIREKLDMLVDEGKVPVDIFMENDLVEVKVREDGEVRIFEKAKYGAKLQ